MAGTGLDEQQLRENQTMMQSIQNRTEPNGDAEESVRTMVSRLEVGAINHKSMPRIIESKCIEKMNEPIRTPNQQEQNALTKQQQQRRSGTTTADPSRPRTVDLLLTTAQVNAAAHHYTSLQIGTVQPNTEVRTKVVRNRNVDLATTNHKTAGEKERNSSDSTTNLKNAKNLLMHSIDSVAGSNQHAPPPTTVSSSKRQTTTTPLPQKSLVEEEKAADDAQQLLAPRLVKWNTLSKFDEKNYVTNDVKLKQKPKYDEIEFEEFQVFDPNNPTAECYDSLNSSK